MGTAGRAIVIRHDEPALRDALASLAPAARVAFAAACAERLRPAFVAYVRTVDPGDAETFEAILDRLWDSLETPKPDERTRGDVQSALDRCMAALPAIDDDSPSLDDVYAEHAGAALAYALHCELSGDAQEAAWAARRAYEATDQFVIRAEQIDLDAPGAEARILAHPIVQHELAAQQADLADLRAGVPYHHLRQRAAADRSWAHRVGV